MSLLSAFTLAAGPFFHPTPPDQPIHELVSPLFVVTADGAHVEVVGTAFVIGRGWAVTAFHVIDDIVRRSRDRAWTEGDTLLDCKLHGVLALDGASRHLPLTFLRAWSSQPMDIAVLAVGLPADWPADHRWRVPVLDLLPPKVGASIFAFGFANATVTSTPGDPIATVDLKPRTARGEVLEIHHEIRDSARLPFPCFRTNARFDGGMSGGPVFDSSTGHVCGIVCSSLPATTDGEEHVSYASSMWPITGIPVDPSAYSPSGGAPFPMFDLFKSGAMQALHLDHVRLGLNLDGKQQVHAQYDKELWDNPTPTSSVQSSALQDRDPSATSDNGAASAGPGRRRSQRDK